MANEIYTAGEKVLAAYEQMASEFRALPHRYECNYMLAKLLTDYMLLSSVPLEGKRVLNVGCSEPLDELWFARRVGEWVAIDLSPASIAAAREVLASELHPDLCRKVTFEEADVRALPYQDESFDVTLAFSTIDHIPAPEDRWKAFREMARVTRKGGYVVVTVPNRLDLYYYYLSRRAQKTGTAPYGYEYCFTPAELRRELVQAGLIPLSFRSIATSPFSWPSRILRRLHLDWLEKYFGARMGYLAQKGKSR